MIETLLLALGLPLIATTLTRASHADIVDAMTWRSPPAFEQPKGDACASVRTNGYAGNVDVKRVGDPCGIFTHHQLVESPAGNDR